MQQEPLPGRRPWLVLGLALAAALGGWALLRRAAPAPDELPLAGARDAAPPRAGDTLEARQERPALERAPGERVLPGTASASAPPEVRGSVQTTDGRPVEGALVTHHEVEHAALRGLPVADGRLLASVLSAHDGTFALAAPHAGQARVRATAPGLGTAHAVVTPAGARLTLTLPREAVLDVEVLALDGPVPGAGRVEVEAGTARMSRPLLAARARIEGLAEGPVRVRVLLEDGRQGMAGPLLLVAGALRATQVVVAPSGGVGGVVRSAEDDEPIAGASVIVAAPGRLVTEGLTDAEGRFGPLPAGAPGETVQVSVAARGWRSALASVPSLPSGATPAEVVLRLEPAEPWLGRVEDEGGAPAAGVEVRYTSDGIAGRTPAATRTDDQGTFSLPPPPPPAPGRRVVLLAEGAQGRAALALRPDTPRPEALVLRLRRGARLRGYVRDERGRAQEGAVLRAQPAFEAPREPGDDEDLLLAVNAAGAAGLTALSDLAGAFELADLTPGPWRLLLEHAGQTREVGEVLRIATSDLDVGEVRVGAGLALEGEVVDPEGRPLAGVRVRVTRNPATGRRPGFALSDATGRFRFTDLEPEGYSVEAEGAAGILARVEVRLPARDPVRLELARGRRLTLDVTGPDGPYAGWVMLTLGRPRQGESGAWRQASAAEQGQARFTDVPAGSWSLRVEARGLLAAPAEMLVLGAERDGHAAVRLAAAASLSGTLRTAAGAAVAGGEITLQDLARQGSVRTLSDDQGRWRLDGRTPGEHALTARGAGGAAVSTRVTLAEAEASTLDLVLAPSGSLRLRVVDERQRGVAGALVAVRPEQAGQLGAQGQGRSGSDGRLVLGDLAAAPVVVQARTRDGRQASQRVEVVAGRTLEVELLLR